jgi:hypothetical protein
MATPPDSDRRASIAAWAMLNTFELLDDRDQEAERLPLISIQAVIDRDVHNVCLGLWDDTDVACVDLRRAAEVSGPTRPEPRSLSRTGSRPY